MKQKEDVVIAIEMERTFSHFQYILLLEFVEGNPLIEIPSILFPSLFKGQSGAKRMKHMGRIIALDVVTNNFDRFPFVWENEGCILHFLPSLLFSFQLYSFFDFIFDDYSFRLQEILGI
jgi:hypothetical protein